MKTTFTHITSTTLVTLIAFGGAFNVGIVSAFADDATSTPAAATDVSATVAPDATTATPDRSASPATPSTPTAQPDAVPAPPSNAPGASSDTTVATPASTTTTTTSAAPADNTTPTTAPAQSSTTTQSQSPDATQTTMHRHGKGGKRGLHRVHVVGSKYTDTFTDGTNTFTFPGDPRIDAHLGEPGAPLPTHGDLTWVSTKTMEKYDTPSGDLESGTYAQESDGSFISNTTDSTAATSSSLSQAVVAFTKLDPTIEPADSPTIALASLPLAASTSAAVDSTATTTPSTAGATSLPSNDAATSTASNALDNVASTTPPLTPADASTTTAANTTTALMQ